jgi:hypothetical protein
MKQSVPGAVATGYNSHQGRVWQENNPVATAPGTDIITSPSLTRRQRNLNRYAIPGVDLQKRSRIA